MQRSPSGSADPLPEQQSEVMLQPETPVPQTQPVQREELAPAPATTAAQSARARAAAATWRSQIAAMLDVPMRRSPVCPIGIDHLADP
jgi:hypothetical protein